MKTAEVTSHDEKSQKAKARKGNHIMKNRKNILTYIVAALSILVTSASWSPAAPAQPHYHGMLTDSSSSTIR